MHLIPDNDHPEPERRPPAHKWEDEHEGATEDEVLPTTPPVSPEYDDEPKEG